LRSGDQLQVGTPFDYERQMKFASCKKCPIRAKPVTRRAGEMDRTFHHANARQGVRVVHELQIDAGVGRTHAAVLRRLGLALFVQGTGTPRSTMLEKFKDDVDSVLFGTDSFWQGVDVPGEALSNVIITRCRSPCRIIR
jgi:ATP-dependent DNA helicase DinG